jgi:hypothetical protein
MADPLRHVTGNRARRGPVHTVPAGPIPAQATEAMIWCSTSRRYMPPARISDS